MNRAPYFAKSITEAFCRSPCQARARYQPFPYTEQMSVGAILSRNGFPKLVGTGGVISSTNATFSDTIYTHLVVTATWPTGDTSTMTVDVDPFYGDVNASLTKSWTTGSTASNVAFSDLNSNVACTFTIVRHLITDTVPTTVPDLSLVVTDTAATATWLSGLVVTAALSVPIYLADNVQTCTGLLQYVTLLDELIFPTRQYAATAYRGDNTETNTYLRFPSQFKDYESWNGTNWLTVTSCIMIMPTRGYTNGVRFWKQDKLTIPLFQWTLSPYGAKCDVNLAADPRYRFVDMMFAYGVTNPNPDVPPWATSGQPAYNGVMSAKTAIRTKATVSSATQFTVTNSTGVLATASWTPPIMSAKKGNFIFDPVALMGTIPTGYVLNPSGGSYYLESLSPFSGTNYGATYWPYV